MILKRQFENKYGTFGELTTGSGLVLQTLELEYKSNHRSVSCVPAGEYLLVDHDSKRHGKTAALVNHDLCVHHYHTANNRSAILFHSANTSDELQGCIAVGMDIGCVKGKWAIIYSRRAMSLLRKEFNTDNKLVIK